MAMRELPPTTGDQVYEAWVIIGDAAPVALGGFRVGDSRTGSLDGSGPAAVEGAVVALTLEPGPGRTAPEGPVVAVGTAATAGDT
jgi:anti-sigma-K factor RskA